MNYKESYRLLNIGCVAAMALALFACMVQIIWIGVLGLIILVLGMLQTLVFYRCPHCGSLFSIRARCPKFCPECGQKLDEQ